MDPSERYAFESRLYVVVGKQCFIEKKLIVLTIGDPSTHLLYDIVYQ